MRITVDIRPLLETRRTGVARYAGHLLRELFAQGGNDYTLYSNAYGHQQPNDFLPYPPHVRPHFTGYPNRLLNLSTFLTGAPTIEGIVPDTDVVYLPNLNFVATKKPLVVTVHDLSFLRYPSFFTPKQRLWHAMVRPERLLRDAAAVVAVSEHTKADIVELFGVDAARIHVVSPGVSLSEPPADTSDTLQRFGVRNPFFLYVGAMEPRKNLGALVAAFAEMPDGVDLVIAGGAGWLDAPVREAIRTSPASARIHVIGYVSDAEKAALYGAAIAFVYPSLYEGFGMPPLEAMACGTPVITSLSSSLGEVVGDAALVADPHDVVGIADAMRAVLFDTGLRKELAARGKERAKLFDWSRSASALRDVFTSLQ